MIKSSDYIKENISKSVKYRLRESHKYEFYILPHSLRTLLNKNDTIITKIKECEFSRSHHDVRILIRFLC